ncbi:MAG: hypothetical protein ABSA11_16715 [Candidatus Bathyarchaeia archaeon]|jgi:hypothetical protein
MVDVSLLQSASYVAAAIGVCVAAFYYALNLRETNKNRRITFTNSVIQQLLTEEGVRKELDCYSMQWTDFDDFKRKYDSRVNPENYSKRSSLWYLYESLGYLYRSGVIDLDTVANICGGFVPYDWLKFKPIIEEYRKTDFGPTSFSNFEYLAEAIMSVRERSEPNARARMDMVEKAHRVAQ